MVTGGGKREDEEVLFEEDWIVSNICHILCPMSSAWYSDIESNRL